MTKTKEGYIKFDCKWIKRQPIPVLKIKKINRWRKKIYDLGLIGCYDDGIGFGNISMRLNKKEFLITGSATGKYRILKGDHYTKVTNFNFQKNSLVCCGPIQASSESLTHAIIYQKNPDVNAVIHIHNLQLWKKLFGRVPTTPKSATYGTPEMALEIAKLLEEENTRESGLIVMGGHREGLVVFGKTLEEAGSVIFGHF